MAVFQRFGLCLGSDFLEGIPFLRYELMHRFIFLIFGFLLNRTLQCRLMDTTYFPASVVFVCGRLRRSGQDLSDCETHRPRQ